MDETHSTDAPADLEAWIGRSRVDTDRVVAFPARGMAALLDRDPHAMGDGSPLPPGWHWLYFRPLPTTSELAGDGHERRGAFLPPVPLERRMWAGGRLSFQDELRVGEVVERTSTIAAVTQKAGRSGPLVFVTVRHEIATERGLAVDEEQDLVYRTGGGSSGTPAGPTPPNSPDWTDSFATGPVQLFRFSALTFNGHRIHYDHPYATAEEGYPGLVVHGPLIALLLLDSFVANARPNPSRFEYRAVAPAFSGETILLSGRPDGDEFALWASVSGRGMAMRATAR